MLDIRTLNQAVLSKASSLSYSVADLAPSTLGDLKTHGLVIWAGASDKTIYNDAGVNHAFRAWHDSLHIKLNAPFTLDGELMVAKAQCLELGSTELSKFIMAEVMGQAEYFAKHGEFPIDQVTFIKQYLKGLI